MAHGVATCFVLDDIHGVAVNLEAHVASVEPDDGVRLHGRVVYEHFFCLEGVIGWRGLLGAYFVERDKHRGIDSTCNVEEGSGDTLHACDATFVKF